MSGREQSGCQLCTQSIPDQSGYYSLPAPLRLLDQQWDDAASWKSPNFTVGSGTLPSCKAWQEWTVSMASSSTSSLQTWNTLWMCFSSPEGGGFLQARQRSDPSTHFPMANPLPFQGMWKNPNACLELLAHSSWKTWGEQGQPRAYHAGNPAALSQCPCAQNTPPPPRHCHRWAPWVTPPTPPSAGTSPPADLHMLLQCLKADTGEGNTAEETLSSGQQAEEAFLELDGFICADTKACPLSPWLIGNVINTGGHCNHCW